MACVSNATSCGVIAHGLKRKRLLFSTAPVALGVGSLTETLRPRRWKPRDKTHPANFTIDPVAKE